MTIISGGTPFSQYEPTPPSAPLPATPATDVSSALLNGRAVAESLMITTGVVRRANGTTTVDDDTLTESPGFDIIFEGACRLKGATAIPSTGAIPGTIVVTQNAELHLPIAGTHDIRPGDIWECTDNPLDPGMVGGTVRIAGVHNATFATARRFPIVANP